MAHLFAEYMVQPEFVLAQKKMPHGAVMAVLWHAVVWASCVSYALRSLPVEALVAVNGLHLLLDCTVVGEWPLRWLKIQSMRSSMEMSMEHEMPVQVSSVQFALAAASEQMYWLTVHLLILYSACWWRA